MPFLGPLTAKMVLQTGGFTGEVRKAADEYRKIVRGLAKDAKVPALQFERQIRREAILGHSGYAMKGDFGSDLKTQMRADRMEAQRSITGINSSVLKRDPYEEIPEIRRSSGKTGDDESKFSLGRMAKGLGVAAGGIEAASIAVKAFRGDWDGVKEQVESMPFGIGHVASAMSDLISEAKGWGKEMRENEEIVKRMEKNNAFEKHASDVVKGVRESGKKFSGAFQDEMGGIGLRGVAAEYQKIDAQERQRIEALQDEKKAALKDAGVDKESKQGREISGEFDRRIRLEAERASNLRIDAMNKARYEEDTAIAKTAAESEQTQLELQHRGDEARIAAIEAAGHEAAEAERHAGRERAAAAIEAQTGLAVKLEQQRQAEHQADLEAGLNAKKLAFDRKNQDAELAGIRQHYTEMRRTASAGEQTLIDEMQRVDEASAVRRNEEQTRDLRTSLRTEAAQSLLRIQKNNYGAELLGIKQQAEQRALELERSGHQEEAQAARQLGELSALEAAKREAMRQSSQAFAEVGAGVSGEGYAAALKENLAGATQQAERVFGGNDRAGPIDLGGEAIALMREIAANTGARQPAIAGA